MVEEISFFYLWDKLNEWKGRQQWDEKKIERKIERKKSHFDVVQSIGF